MAETTSTSLAAIIPEVWADQAQAKFAGAVKVLTSGAVLYDNSLQGNPGDTIHFPKWDALTDLDDLTEGVPMVPEEMGASDSTATIKEAGKAVEITDKAILTALGNPQDEAQRQFGLLAARKLDGDLIAAATAPGALTTATATTVDISWDAIVDGIAEFGDEWEPSDFAGLFIRSEQLATLFKDPNFVDASKIGGSSTIRSGTLGNIGGVPVSLTNRLATGQWALLKNNCLGALYKRRPLVETDRDILKRSTVVTTNVHYAVKRLDDSGVLVGTITP